MKVTLLAVGRLKAGPIQALFDDYVRRIGWPLELVEVEERRALPAPALKGREGALILDALAALSRKSPDLAVLVLDAGGSSLTSEAFARRIARWRDGGRDLAFVIGGADGLARPVLDRADLVLSLGAMTWPHLIVRVLLAEQLYRAQSILAGHPYHRG